MKTIATKWKLFYQITLLLMGHLFINSNSFADSDPCGGPSALFNLLNRPSQLDSPCVVPFKKVILEAGYEYLSLIGGGRSQDYPEVVIRIGLPHQNEFIAILPDSNHQSVAPRTGYFPNVIGIKHEFGYTKYWLASVEGLLTLPTGGGAFGSNKYDPTINGIIQLSLTPSIALIFMLGVNWQSLPAINGGHRFTTINPDLVLSWQINDKLLVFGETYGQSLTGPKQGSGINADAGVMFLLTRRLEIDAELGYRVSGKLGGLKNYYGMGLGILFG